jgi:transcription antitermination protein NusB
MGRRREGREAAMQFLFANDVHGEVSEVDSSEFWGLHSAKSHVRKHAERLVKGIQAHQADIDGRISSAVQNFAFDRLGTVDRNIMRLAIYEMLFEPGVPYVVAINEAIEIAKTYGDTQTKKFVNGVLDRIARGLPPKQKAAPTPDDEDEEEAAAAVESPNPQP